MVMKVHATRIGMKEKYTKIKWFRATLDSWFGCKNRSCKKLVVANDSLGALSKQV